jgi:hypothetical protein
MCEGLCVVRCQKKKVHCKTVLTIIIILVLNMVSEIRILTCLLAPWCRVLLEKLTGLHLVNKFPAFHGTRRFITAHTSVRHLSLSWASPIQSIYPQPTSWRSSPILSTHLRLGLPSGLFPSDETNVSLFRNAFVTQVCIVIRGIELEFISPYPGSPLPNFLCL